MHPIIPIRFLTSLFVARLGPAVLADGRSSHGMPQHRPGGTNENSPRFQPGVRNPQETPPLSLGERGRVRAGILAPKGPRKAATGEAQRNPWHAERVCYSVPVGAEENIVRRSTYGNITESVLE